MKKERKETLQVPLLDTIKIKKTGMTLKEIKKLKSQLHRNEFKILQVKIKPVGRRKEVANG